ncbi:MAG: hypothetical protein KJ634_00080 [Gammaproteobacteria bacterium]|nr:hypothetical protein [Gammaproteobacteria bacterium]MBU1413995.1 hypothetical protein [Gammaproteobacteria bacterium]
MADSSAGSNLVWFPEIVNAHKQERAMDVQIIEAKTGRLLGTYPIVLGGLNYTPSEHEFFDLAWRCAVDDKLADANHRDQYTIRFP